MSDEAISQALASGGYLPSNTFEVVAKAEVVILCLPTPLTKDYQPDLSHRESALQSLSPYLAPNTLVINESTVAPGTTRSTIATLLSKTAIPFELAYSP